MLTALKGGALYVAGALVLALIGAVTYLTANGNITGSDALVVFTGMLTAVTGVTAAHVTGTQVASALNTPPPVAAPVAATSTPAPTAPTEQVI